MSEWLHQYWWAIFGVVASCIYVAWRMRSDGVEGSFLHRLLLALFPVLNPGSAEFKQLTPRALWLVLVGLVFVALASLLVSVLSSG